MDKENINQRGVRFRIFPSKQENRAIYVYFYKILPFVEVNINGSVLKRYILLINNLTNGLQLHQFLKTCSPQ